MYASVLRIFELCVIMAYPDLFGLSIGGRLGCLFHQIIINIIFLKPRSWSYLEVICVNIFDVTVMFDVVQFTWFQLVSNSVKYIATFLIRNIFGADGRRKKSKSILNDGRFLFSIIFIAYLVLYSPSTSWFKQDRFEDVLTVPRELRDLERKICPHVRPAEFLAMKGGCALNFVANGQGAQFVWTFTPILNPIFCALHYERKFWASQSLCFLYLCRKSIYRTSDKTWAWIQLGVSFGPGDLLRWWSMILLNCSINSNSNVLILTLTHNTSY